MCEIISKDIWNEQEEIVNNASAVCDHNRQLQIDNKKL